MKMFTSLILAVVGVLCLGGVVNAEENWPNKPIKIIVGYAAGGGSDVTVRILADKLQKELGQPLVVQNKGGASGQIGMKLARNATPDGYTMYGGAVTASMAASLIANKDVITIDDFAPIGGYFENVRALFGQVDAPYKNWEEFVEYVKKNPNEVSIGASNAWCMYLLKHVAKKENMQYKVVMYKSGSQAAADFFGGHIQTIEAGVASPMYQAAVNDKATVLIGLCNSKILNYEQVPSIASKGFLPMVSEHGFLMPKGTSPVIVNKFAAALKKVLADPDVIETFEKLGSIARFLPAKAFAETCTGGLKSLEVLIQSNQEK